MHAHVKTAKFTPKIKEYEIFYLRYGYFGYGLWLKLVTTAIN